MHSGGWTLTAGAAAVLVATSATSQSLVKGSAVTAKPAVAAQDLDGNGVAGIAVAPIPHHGLGDAINDRLLRAAAPRDNS